MKQKKTSDTRIARDSYLIEHIRHEDLTNTIIILMVIRVIVITMIMIIIMIK